MMEVSNSHVGLSDRRQLCHSCRQLRPAHTFTYQVGSKIYCSQLCAKRAAIPKPRTPDEP